MHLHKYGVVVTPAHIEPGPFLSVWLIKLSLSLKCHASYSATFSIVFYVLLWALQLLACEVKGFYLWDVGIAMKDFFLLLYYIFPSDYLNKPSAPFASVIGNHSVTLVWKAANISGVKYVIQWKFNKLPGDWRYTEVREETSFYFARKLALLWSFLFFTKILDNLLGTWKRFSKSWVARGSWDAVDDSPFPPTQELGTLMETSRQQVQN